jgi:hypothetical protein
MDPVARQLVLILFLSGCVFDAGGTASDSSPGSEGWIASDAGSGVDHTPSDQTTDPITSDQVADQTAPPDQTAPVDQTLPPDKGAIIPVSSSALGQAFVNTTVQCVSFFDGSVTLAGAGQPTVSWVGGQPSVIVVWDPNTCDWEDPDNLGSNWSSGGLLVRGATINGSGQLVLQPGTTIQDINTLNVNPDGTFQVDYFEPDDSLLPSYPQLVKPVTKAKELILQLGNA